MSQSIEQPARHPVVHPFDPQPPPGPAEPPGDRRWKRKGEGGRRTKDEWEVLAKRALNRQRRLHRVRFFRDRQHRPYVVPSNTRITQRSRGNKRTTNEWNLPITDPQRPTPPVCPAIIQSTRPIRQRDLKPVPDRIPPADRMDPPSAQPGPTVDISSEPREQDDLPPDFG